MLSIKCGSFMLLQLLLLYAAVRASHAGRHRRQAFVLAHQDPNTCTLPEGGAGRCVQPMQCPRIYAILSARPIPPDRFTYLRQSICRRDDLGRPMFCCAEGGSAVQPLTSGESRPSSAATTTTTSTTVPPTQPLTQPPTQPPIQSSTPPPSQPPTQAPPQPLVQSSTVAPIESPATAPPPVETTGTTIGPNPFVLSTTGEPSESTTVAISEEAVETSGSGSAGGDATSPEPAAVLPGLSECGNSNVTLPRIVGGRDVNQGDWPWVAALGYDNGRGAITYSCGAALISKRYVLTAAHCVVGQAGLRVVRLGDHDLSRTDDVTHEDFGIERRISHEGYDENFSNDIALLRLDSDVVFKKHISPICLPRFPSYRPPEVGAQPFVAGWGSVQYNQRSSNVLRDVAVPIVNTTSCARSYARFRTVRVDERTLCAGYADGGRDACQGDSGGPLIHPVFNIGESTKYYLVGVVSLGFRCAEPGYPGIYSKISHFMPWILERIS